MDGQPDSTQAFSALTILPESDKARIASGIVGCWGGFPTPTEVAQTARVRLVAASLPQRCPDVVTDGRTVYYAPHCDQRELGTRIFRGVAAALLERDRGEHAVADVYRLAARLAAPPCLVRRVGIERAVEQQRWATERFLRAWWASM